MPYADEATRQAWIESILAGDVPTLDFARALDEKPSTIKTVGAAEYFEVCRRERQGMFRIARMEHSRPGYIFSVYYPQPEQKNLL